MEEIRNLSFKARSRQAQSSLAKLVAKKLKDFESVNKFVQDFLGKELVEMDAKPNQYHVYGFYIMLVKEIVASTDDKNEKAEKPEKAAKKLELMSLLYFEAMKNSMAGYKAMRLLL